MTTDYIKDWEEELEEFGMLHNEDCDVNDEDGSYDGCHCANMEGLKAFIRTLISQVKAEERERIRKRLETSIVTTCHNCDKGVHMFPDDVTKELEKALSTSEGEESDLLPFKHGEEGTHYSCQDAIDEELGCCGCSGHKCSQEGDWNESQKIVKHAMSEVDKRVEGDTK